MYQDYEDLGHFMLSATPPAARRCLPVEDINDDKAATDAVSLPFCVRLLQVTDLHCFPKDCQEFQGVPLLDAHERCLRLVDQLVRDVRPDVILLTGDIIDGRGPWAPDDVTQAVRDLIPHFHQTPWCFVPGNHDDDHSPWKRHDLQQIFQLDGCLQKGARRGFHHTILLSKSTFINHETVTIQVRLHLFDSGGNHPNPRIMYCCTPPEAVRGFVEFHKQQHQKQQYQQQQQQQRQQKFKETTISAASTTVRPTELVYFHIPLPEYQFIDPVIGHNNLFEAALEGGKIPKPLHRWLWLVRLFKLHRIAGCSRGPDSGLFHAMLQAKRSYGANIVAAFCGHDHHSDAVFHRQGIFLGYGRSGAMTPPFDWEGKAPNDLAPGARVVQVDCAGRTQTWIQNRDGAESDSFLDMVRTEKESDGAPKQNIYLA